MKGQILEMVLIVGLIMSLLLVSVVSTVNGLIRVEGIASGYVSQEEALSSGIDYTRYLLANETTQGTLSLPQGTIEVVMNTPNVVGNVYEYYDVLITYTPQFGSKVFWTVELVKDNVTLSSWVISIEGGST